MWNLAGAALFCLYPSSDQGLSFITSGNQNSGDSVTWKLSWTFDCFSQFSHSASKAEATGCRGNRAPSEKDVGKQKKSRGHTMPMTNNPE